MSALLTLPMCATFTFVLVRSGTTKLVPMGRQLKFFIPATSTLLTFSILFTLPINVDRSFSVWLLNNLEGKELSLSQAELKFSEFFKPSSGEIVRRIQEQISIGNIEKTKSGSIQLSERGSFLISVFKMIRIFFHLNSKYTSQTTDFRIKYGNVK